MNPAGDPARGFALLATALLVVAVVWLIVKITIAARDERERRIAKRVADELRGRS